MEIKVLGPGCRKCDRQYEEARKAIEEAGVDAALSKVADLGEIADHGVMFTPAVVVDGEVVASGSVVKSAKLAALLREASR